MKNTTLLISAFFLLISVVRGQSVLQPAGTVRVTAKPQNIYIEKSDFAQHLNFDFLLENLTDEKLSLTCIELSVFDKQGKLAHRDLTNLYGRESLAFKPQPVLEVKGKALVFNPFHTFRADLPLDQLSFEFSLVSQDDKQWHRVICKVNPVFYETKTDLILPVKGRVLVWDGHDYPSHHRRFDYTDPYFEKQGIEANFQRYGYDFVVVDEAGSMYSGQPKHTHDWFGDYKDNNADYYGFGVPVYAAGSGRVVDMHDGEADNRTFNNAELATREKAYGGNYVIIDHLNGEFSWFGHLKQGSIKVKPGQMVKQGEVIGAMGASGSSLFPHLHYELRTGDGAKTVEGLPSYFSNFERVMGSKKVKVKKGQVDSGSVVESR